MSQNSQADEVLFAQAVQIATQMLRPEDSKMRERDFGDYFAGLVRMGMHAVRAARSEAGFDES